MSHHRGSGHFPGGHHHPLPRSQSEYHHSSASSLTPASSSASSSARSSRVWENQQVLALLVSPSFYGSLQEIIFFPPAEAAVLLQCELYGSCRYIEFSFQCLYNGLWNFFVEKTCNSSIFSSTLLLLVKKFQEFKKKTCLWLIFLSKLARIIEFDCTIFYVTI